MRDTPPEFACKYHRMLAALPVERRAYMVSDMFDLARTLARAGMLADHPGATEADVRRRIFQRFYEGKLPQSLIDRVLRDIDERFDGQPAVPA